MTDLPIAPEKELELEDIEEVYVIEIGCPIKMKYQNTVTMEWDEHTYPKGTQFLKVFGGQHPHKGKGGGKRQGWRFFDCFVRPELPLLRIYFHPKGKLHKHYVIPVEKAREDGLLPEVADSGN